MSVLNLSGDEAPECPLCMEFLELDDINFYPCTCGYQICRFCWNKLRTEGNGLCPACRQAYSENPADFKPLTSEELAKIKAEKRQKDQAKKQKISENRKHLANVRVVQKNLVFVVGLSPRLADPDILKKPDYFGKFGKIHKVVINHSTQYAGSQIQQGPSASAYVTYYKSEDALKAIQAVNNIYIDGRTLKASLGTTKYCSHFMKNQACPKSDCMYLHELGDDAASFTKEQMQQGRHTEYEKNLHEDMLANLALLAAGESPPSPSQLDSDTETADRELLAGMTGAVIANRPAPVDQAWPDLSNAHTQNSFKTSRNIHNIKEDDKSSKSKSCDSSDEDSLSACPAVPSLAPDDQPSCVSTAITPPANNRIVDNTPQFPSRNLPNTESETGWLDTDLKVSNNFLEEDDLGFDPFHETQKALAEMLESESAAAETNKVPSFCPDWRGSPSAATRPPPGFHNNVQQPGLPHNHFSNFNYLSDQPLGHHIPGNGSGIAIGSGIENLFGRVGSGQQIRSSGPAPGFGHGQHSSSSDLVNHGLLGGMNKQTHEQQHSRLLLDHKLPQNSANDGFNMKDWQDGLRALLPNVNVSFGSNSQHPGQQQQQQQFGLQQHNYHHNNLPHHTNRLQQNQTNWEGLSSGFGNDWTMLDPAIVSGQLAHSDRQDLGHHHVLPEPRSESPPAWITQNLEQLTAEPGPYNNHQASLVPAFNNLGLGIGGARSGGLGGARTAGAGGWGHSAAATPPPGFTHHRGAQLQPHYPGFGINKNSEAQKIGDF